MNSKPTILVVDDESMNRQIVLDILEQSGEDYSILSANNGRVALDIIKRLVPDLILMDWNMPELSGIETVKQLKADEYTHEVPVLMVTSVSSSEKLQEAFESGVVDYITKPVNKIELLARVKSALKTSLYYKEIVRQKNEIETQKADITHSIKYAQHIQQAILPDTTEIANAFKDSFILYKPRDIVSGDFYWFTEKDKYYIAACDCTGHGVPGAFVSMIGNILLNQVIIEKDLTDTGDILDELNKGMKAIFSRKGDGIQLMDGMDMALCAISRDSSSVEFSGAYNSLYVLRDSDFIVMAADRKPIGGHTPSSFRFSTKKCDLRPGDTMYIFSDGFADQFGGPNRKKLKSKAFMEMLLDIKDRNMSEQAEILNAEFTGWKGEHEQVDDVLVIGIRV